MADHEALARPAAAQATATRHTARSPERERLQRRVAERSRAHEMRLAGRAPGPRPIQPAAAGGGVIQRVAWHDKAHGTVPVQNDPEIPAINGVTMDGTTQINVAGFPFQGPQYALPEQTGADKPKVVAAIAEVLGGVSHPKSGKFLSRSQLAANNFAASVAAGNIAGIAPPAARNVYKSAIDPYVVRVPGRTEEGARIALHYQFGVDSYGYIVKIEQEGKTYAMHGERGQDALQSEQRTKLKKGLIDDPLFDQFSSAHDTDNPEENIAETAAKSTTGEDLALYGIGKRQSPDPSLAKLKQKSNRLDAMARIGGEGSRWVCVRQQAKAGKLTNASFFHTECPDDDESVIGMTFQTLWGCWGSLFESRFNIPDADVKDVIEQAYFDGDGRVLKRPAEQVKGTDYDLG